MREIEIIGSGISTQLNEILEQPQYKLTKYSTIQTYKSGKELRREKKKKNVKTNKL